MITVEVVLALADSQSVQTVAVERDTLILDAIAASGVLASVSREAKSDWSYGVWGQVVAQDYRVKDGDRIEIYRPLIIDPREARRKLAAAGRTMGPPKSN